MVRRGFTLIEVVIVVALIAILATLLVVNLSGVQSRSKLVKTTTQLQDLTKAVTQYVQDNAEQYPAESAQGAIPTGLEKYLPGEKWPTSAWPHGVYDWDNWTTVGGVPTAQVYQITYRLCALSDPAEYCNDAKLFPQFTRNSSIFYCLQGSCVPDQTIITAPGYCVNCKPKEQNY